MSPAARARIALRIAATDRTFELCDVRGDRVWVGRCIHCRARVVVEASGATIATIEHIEPLTHGGTDAIENVALACARCNHGKGRRLDVRRRDDPTLRAVVEMLAARRRERWRDPA